MWAIESDTEQILKSVLAGAPFVPARCTVIGQSEVEWWEGKPGDAIVMASGGSPADRWLGEQIVSSQLATIGYKRAQFTFDAEHHTAGWPDIMQKAKRLVQSANVTLLRNGWNNIVAHVVGDHGEYNCEIGRDDPESRSITTWQCECPWDQYAWQRTRKWKKYEGRPCAHVLATFWKSQGTPLDEGPPEGSNLPPGQKAGPPAQAPSSPMPGGGPKPPAEVPSPEMPRSFGPEEALGESAPQTMAPPGEGPLPTPPMDQLAEQAPPIPGQTPGGLPANPSIVSVPGAKMPTPFNPIQFPGGTYSKMSALDDPYWMQEQCGSVALALHRKYGLPIRLLRDGSDIAHVYVQHLDGQGQDARGIRPVQSIHDDFPVEYTHHDEPISEEQLLELMGEEDDKPLYGYDSKVEQHIASSEVCDSWLPEHRTYKMSADEFVAPEIVRLKDEGYGIAEGKSEEHGAGQYQSIPAGSEGEVLGQDTGTGWVEVIFPLHESSYLEPYHVKIFCNPSDIEHTNKQPPGPFVQRRR